MLALTAFANPASTDRERPPWRRMWSVLPVKFNPEVDLGSLLVALSLIGGVSYWAVTSSNTANNAIQSVAALRGDVAALRVDTNEQFKGVRADIANLPDVRAQLVQMERRMDANDSRMDAQSKRLELLEREVIQTRSDVDNLIRGRVK